MQIIFNGKSYGKPEDMSANERAAYEQMQQIFVDANGNGIPDFLEGDVAKNVITAFTSNVNFNGQVYNSLDELPEPARQKVQDAFGKLKQFGIVNAGNFTAPNTNTSDLAFPRSEPVAQVGQPMGEVQPNRWLVIFATLGGMLICGLVIAVIFLLQR